MRTLLLDQTLWDLCLDASGNLAVATEPYQTAQDVASAAKLFVGELWYDTAKGIPYFDLVLGKAPPPPLIKALLVKAALTVPGVTSAQCTLAAIENRTLSGQIRIDGATVSFVGTTTTIGIA